MGLARGSSLQTHPWPLCYVTDKILSPSETEQLCWKSQLKPAFASYPLPSPIFILWAALKERSLDVSLLRASETGNFPPFHLFFLFLSCDMKASPSPSQVASLRSLWGDQSWWHLAGLLAPELRTARWLIVSISCWKLLRNLANLMMHEVFGLLCSKVLCLEYVLLSKFSSRVPQRTAFDGTAKTASSSV